MTKSSKTFWSSDVHTSSVFFLIAGEMSFPSSPYLMTFIHSAQSFYTTHPGQGRYRGACTVYNMFLQEINPIKKMKQYITS